MPSLRPGTFVRDATKPDRIEFGELGWSGALTLRPA